MSYKNRKVAFTFTQIQRLPIRNFYRNTKVSLNKLLQSLLNFYRNTKVTFKSISEIQRLP